MIRFALALALAVSCASAQGYLWPTAGPAQGAFAVAPAGYASVPIPPVSSILPTSFVTASGSFRPTFVRQGWWVTVGGTDVLRVELEHDPVAWLASGGSGVYEPSAANSYLGIHARPQSGLNILAPWAPDWLPLFFAELSPTDWSGGIATTSAIFQGGTQAALSGSVWSVSVAGFMPDALGGSPLFFESDTIDVVIP